MKRYLCLLLSLCAAYAQYRPAGFVEWPAGVEIGAVSAVQVDSQGGLYILHRGTPPILAFHPDGRYRQGWGSGLFKVPHGLRLDPQGNLWTTDNGNHLLRKFSPDGKLLQTLGDLFKSPDDLVFASTGDIYVADTGNRRIARLSPDGRFRSEFRHDFQTAHALAIDERDRIYVADRGNNRVLVFEPDGKFIAAWTGFGNPFGLLVVGRQLLVTEGDIHRVFHLDRNGDVLASWGGPEQLQLPHLMAAGRDGSLYIAEVNGKRVQKFRLVTEQSEAAHLPLFQPPPNKPKEVSTLTATVRPAPNRDRKGADAPKRNYIDNHIFTRLQQDAIPHAPLSSDEEFARRAWLDATGSIPPVNDLLAFLNNQDPQKRDKLIDRLVASDAFLDRWTFYFEDLFRAGGRMGFGLNLFHYWTREWLRLDRPYNEVVSDLLTQGGKTSFSVPGALYFARDFVKAKDDPEAPDAHDLVNIPDTIDEFTITYSKVFLGLNLACISCHDGKGHLEKVNRYLTGKTREQFFQQSAFYGRTRQLMNWENGFQANQEYTVDDLGPGYDKASESIVRVPRASKGIAEPRFILTNEPPVAGRNQRDELARLLTSHPQFARAFVNRIWAELMGFGIVEPVDEFDLDRADQASNPALLDAMARDFAEHRYSFRHFVQTVMKSSAYQLSSRFEGEWQEHYTPYYARKYVRMLSAAELHDAITLATARKTPLVQAMSDPKRAAGDAGSMLKVFGQSNRDDMPKKTPPSALQAMLLMQSKLVAGPQVEELVKSTPDNAALVDRIYLTTISRRPTDPERTVALKTLDPDRRRGAENIQWALINSPEFLFNY